MKTKAIKEQALFCLESSCYNSSACLLITKKMLQEAAIGYTFSAQRDNACGRGETEQVLKVIYRDMQGVACVLSNWGTTDSPNPQLTQSPDELVWFEFID